MTKPIPYGLNLILALSAVLLCSCASKMSSSNLPGPSDLDAPTEFTTTASGLKYRILRKSDGRKPTKSERVEVHYKGWLDVGTVFDSSYKRGEPTKFGLFEVIPGWTEGIALVGEGGMIGLEIPSEMGYGARGMSPVIPPNATLHFTVELLEVL